MPNPLRRADTVRFLQKNAVHEVFRNKDKYIEAMSRDFDADSITLITGIIDSLVDKQ